MGTCFLYSQNTMEALKCPVLDESYPTDVSTVEKLNGSATFSISISEKGNPDEYTYQWYVNDEAVSGATSSTYTKTGLIDGTNGTYYVYCAVTNEAGTVNSRVATLTVKPYYPVFTYSGSSELLKGNYNWRIKFKTSGTLNFSSLGNTSSIDLFLVGGGGGGGAHSNGGGGGGGGYTATHKKKSVNTNTNYSIVIGAGGASKGNGGSTSGFGESVSGGYAGGSTVVSTYNYYGGNGGSGGGAGRLYQDQAAYVGGSDGSNGGGTYYGTGQGTTTREFGETSGDLYAGGGGGGNATGWDYSSYRTAGGNGGGGAGGYWGVTGVDGTTNLGGGGGGNGRQGSGGGAGGSGIVVIRNAR